MRELLERDPAPRTARLERKVWDDTFWEGATPPVLARRRHGDPLFYDEFYAWYKSHPQS